MKYQTSANNETLEVSFRPGVNGVTPVVTAHFMLKDRATNMLESTLQRNPDLATKYERVFTALREAGFTVVPKSQIGKGNRGITGITISKSDDGQATPPNPDAPSIEAQVVAVLEEIGFEKAQERLTSASGAYRQTISGHVPSTGNYGRGRWDNW